MGDDWAYAKARELTQNQLRLVRKQIAFYKAEEKRLVEELEKMPLPGQIPLPTLEEK